MLWIELEDGVVWVDVECLFVGVFLGGNEFL